MANTVVERLQKLSDEIAAKRAEIRSYDNYGKETFLAFDSYNLGLTTALDMLGNFTTMLANETEAHQCD